MKFVVAFLVWGMVLLGEHLISPIPDAKYDEKKAQLGKLLFHDPILSRDGVVSCATCHILSDGGDDNAMVATGIGEQNGTINTPTVLNSVFNFRQFWNGRARNLVEQAAGPIENPIEMGSDFKELIPKLQQSGYVVRFASLYSNGITRENILDAIAEFEKALVTPGSRFDRFLKGEVDALDEAEKEGYRLFMARGCIACHNGVNLGGNMYNKFGILGGLQSNDIGREAITGKERDRYFFKVPTLRNITLTAPYFHDGRTQSLHEAVSIMARHQLVRDLPKEEVDNIVTFLKTLTGDIPEIMKRKP